MNDDLAIGNMVAKLGMMEGHDLTERDNAWQALNQSKRVSSEITAPDGLPLSSNP